MTRRQTRDSSEYLMISGPRRLSSDGFLSAEISWLRRHGWGDEESWVVDGSGRAHDAAMTRRGATTELDLKRKGVYTAVNIVWPGEDLGQVTSGDPTYPARGKIGSALRDHAPVLSVLLGNGNATNGS